MLKKEKAECFSSSYILTLVHWELIDIALVAKIGNEVLLGGTKHQIVYNLTRNERFP